MHLWLLYRTACGWGNFSGSHQQKPAKPISPRGGSRSAADRRTGYEVAGGLKKIQRLPGIIPDKNRLDKTGGLGSPQRPFGYFSGEGKVPRGAGAEPPSEQPLSPRGPAERKSETTFSTRAVRRSRLTAAPVTRWPQAQRTFSGNWVSPLGKNRLGKKGGPGSPRRAFAYFSRAGKVGRRRHTPPGRGTPLKNRAFCASKSGPAGGMPSSKKKKSHSAAGGHAAKKSVSQPEGLKKVIR